MKEKSTEQQLLHLVLIGSFIFLILAGATLGGAVLTGAVLTGAALTELSSCGGRSYANKSYTNRGCNTLPAWTSV